ncbi:MAG: phage holin family protein [Oscillospiraceae bacterium]|nr:phage holin family protein [Oscillospiraceae bacterium]
MIESTPIFEAVISLIAAIIAYKVIPYIQIKTTAEQQARMKMWAQIGVNAAEQIYSGKKTGKLKKSYVEDFLAGQGFHLDEVTLDALIESEVHQLWENIEEDV